MPGRGGVTAGSLRPWHQRVDALRASWTLRLLENKVVELGIVDRAKDSTIHRTLKKTVSNPIAASAGHPADNSAFVGAMEDVLLSTRATRSRLPLVCLDETSKQLLAETRVPIPANHGQPAVRRMGQA